MSKKKSNEEIVENTITEETPKEEVEVVKYEKKEIKVVNDKTKKIIIAVIAVVVFIAIVALLLKIFKNDDIKRVSKVLPQKYYSIECLDSYCDGIVAYKGKRTGKSKVTLLNSNGKTVAKYTEKYNPKDKIRKEPSALTDNYFIFKKINVSTSKIVGYSIANKRGKEVFATEKTLKILNDNLIVMDDTNKGINGYSIYNAKGKELHKNVNDYEKYVEGKVISAEIDGVKQILNANGDVVLSDYYVATTIRDEQNETLYLLVEDSKNNSYNYFDIKSLKIVGDSFQNYTRNGDGTLTITKKENNSIVKYTLDRKGNQKLVGNSKSQSEIADILRKKIDTKKYNLYLTSIYDENQKYVFADDLSNKSFGLYNIKKNKFSKLYDYKKDVSNLYSSISKVNNENNLNYYQISCSTYSCDKNNFYVYDLQDGRVLYSVSDSKLKIQNYYQYGKDYKVIKYSYSSSDDEYKGKYVLYGKDNKEIVKSTNNIVVIGEKQLVGYDSSTSLILYSAKTNKVLNDEKNLGTKVVLDNRTYYRYQTVNNTILLNEKGKEVLKIDSSSDIIYSDKVLVYIKDKKAYIFDASSSKTRKYKLKNNEKMNDASGDLISPYRGALFINNSADKVIKVVNSRGNVIKKIRKAEIESVYKTTDKNVIIITKNLNGKTINYGLYIAK